MTLRLRRSELAVPASNPRMIEKAAASDADYVFLDLEDAVAPADKEQARANVVAALNDIDWAASAKTVSIRINGIDTHYMYRDVVDIVERAGDRLDTILVAQGVSMGGRNLLLGLFSDPDGPEAGVVSPFPHPFGQSALDDEKLGNAPGGGHRELEHMNVKLEKITKLVQFKKCFYFFSYIMKSISKFTSRFLKNVFGIAEVAVARPVWRRGRRRGARHYRFWLGRVDDNRYG